MARYIERAENIARVLDVTNHMSLMPNAFHNETGQWRPAVLIADTATSFEDNYGDYSAANVIRFLALDERNPSSIVSALNRARENARAVRAAKIGRAHV